MPNSACNFLKIGSPIPTGHPLITHEITPPTVSLFFLASSITDINFSANFLSGHLTILFSVLSKSNSL